MTRERLVVRSGSDLRKVRRVSFAARSSGLVSLVIAGLLWGTGGITGRAIGDDTPLSPIAIAGFRLGLGGLLVIVALLVTGHRPPHSVMAWRRVIAVAGLAGIFQAAYFSAVAVGSVSVATLVAIGSSPVFVLAYESARRRTVPRPPEALVVVLALTGLTMLVGGPTGSTGLGQELACAGFAALSGLAFAAFTLLGRRPLVGVDEQTVTGYGFGLGGGTLVVVAAFAIGVGFSPSTRTVSLLAFLALAPTALAYVLFFRGLRSVPAATATVIALLEPLTATVLSIVLLGDRLSRIGVVGALLLGLAIVASSRTPAGPSAGGV